MAIYLSRLSRVLFFIRVLHSRIIHPAATTGYLILAESLHRRLAFRHRPINVIIFIYPAPRIRNDRYVRFAIPFRRLSHWIRRFGKDRLPSRTLPTLAGLSFIARSSAFICPSWSSRQDIIVMSRFCLHMRKITQLDINVLNCTLSPLNDVHLTILSARWQEPRRQQLQRRSYNAIRSNWRNQCTSGDRTAGNVGNLAVRRHTRTNLCIQSWLSIQTISRPLL